MVLLLTGCGLTATLAAPEPAARSAAGASGGRLSGKVPLPIPRPEDLGEEETEQAEEEPAVVAPLPANPPSMALPGRNGPPPSFSAPPPPGTPPSRAVLFPHPPGSEVQTAAPGSLPPMCAALVAQNMIVAAPAHAVSVRPGCALPAPVQLSGVRLEDGRLVTFSPAAILRCEAAAHVADWVRDDLAPAAAALGSPLETLKVAASYDCRPRNRIVGAKMSEHGQGIAMDVGGFILEDKRVLEVKASGLPLSLQAAMKASACMKFSTVLGPGSDGYHEDHIHVDMAVRRLDIKLCRWEMRPPSGAAVAASARALSAAVKNASPADPAPQPEAAATGEAPAEADAGEDDVPLPAPRPASTAAAPPKPKPSGKTSASGSKPSGPLWGGAGGGGLYTPR